MKTIQFTFNFPEKLHIDDGKIIHEYVSQPLAAQTRRLSSSLPPLPETDSQEYVRNWCSTHTTLVQSNNKTNADITVFEDADSLGSSLQESIEAYPKPLNFDNVTHRGGNKVHENPADISSPYRKLSRESGILTLPDSTLEYTELDELEKREVTSNPAENCCRRNSGYCTCSSESPQEKNVTEEGIRKSFDGIVERSDLDCAKIGESLLAGSNTSSEPSFVTVSELYRYTDDEEGVTLFEKRLLRNVSRWVAYLILVDLLI